MREDSVSIREKAVSIAERNAAAIGSVSSNIRQAQAMSKRQGMARRHAFIDGDISTGAIDARNLLHTPPAQGDEDSEFDLNFPPLDSSVRSSVVGEKGSGQPASDSRRRRASVSVPMAVSGPPLIQSQQQQSQQVPKLFSAEAAQSIVSAVIQMGFTLQDQETFTAVLVEKVAHSHAASSLHLLFQLPPPPNVLFSRLELFCNADPLKLAPVLPNFSLVRRNKPALTCSS